MAGEAALAVLKASAASFPCSSFSSLRAHPLAGRLRRHMQEGRQDRHGVHPDRNLEQNGAHQHTDNGERGGQAKAPDVKTCRKRHGEHPQEPVQRTMKRLMQVWARVE